MAEGEIVGDHRDPFVFELLGGVLAERMTRLRRGAARPHEPRIGLALGHIFRARNREDRRARGADVVIDRQGFERGERADEDRDVEALDQFLRLGAGLRGIAGGVGGVKLDRPARERVVALLEEDREALFHLQSAGGERPGLDGEKSDAQGRRLRHCRGHLEDPRRHAGGECSLDHGPAIDGHGVPPSGCFFKRRRPACRGRAIWATHHGSMFFPPGQVSRL